MNISLKGQIIKIGEVYNIKYDYVQSATVTGIFRVEGIRTHSVDPASAVDEIELNNHYRQSVVIVTPIMYNVSWGKIRIPVDKYLIGALSNKKLFVIYLSLITFCEKIQI